MDLQTLFYIMAIVTMTLAIGVLIGAIVLMFYIQQKVSDTKQFVEKKIENVTQPVESVINTGSSFARRLLNKFV